MAKAYPPDQLAAGVFYLTTAFCLSVIVGVVVILWLMP